MVDIQVKTSDLLSLSQQLIPKQLALAFGIALGDEHHEDDKQALLHNSIAVKARTSQERQPSASLKRHRDADGGTDSRPATSAAKGGAPPTSSQQTTPAPHPAVSQPAATSALQQMSSGMQQQDAAAMAHAAASMQAAALAQQAAASMQTTTAMAHAQAAAAAATSMQTTSGLSGGYHAHPSAAAPGGPAMLSAYRGFPAAAVGHAYHYNGHPLMPYMHAAPQAMPTMSGISGSMGCGAMSMYSDYQGMRQDDEADDNQARALKRPRLVWTPQLHKIFEEAVQKLGVDKAVPKTIMQMMKVEGLTRENVASHLQKYRLSLKKTDGDGKASAAAVSGDNAGDGTGDGSGSEKNGQEAGNGAATSRAAAGGTSGGSGSGSGTPVDDSSSGGDGIGSTGEGGTSSCKDKDMGNGLVPRASEDDAELADKMEVMEQMSVDAEHPADAVAAAAAAAAAVADDAAVSG